MNKIHAKILPIVILNWNNFKDTEECIDSILESGIDKVKIYLLDNGSETNDTHAIQKKYGENSSINIRFFPENLGFTRAHNTIIKELLDEDYPNIFLLNNDTKIGKTSLLKLLEHTKKGGIDMLCCKMIDYHQRELMDNAGHYILSSGEILPIGHHEKASKYNKPFLTVGNCGGAALYSSKLLKDIGLFDEFFETGYEDAELGFRAFNAGYECHFDPEIIVYHKMGQSIKKIFNVDYVLKTQLNIYYTYLKLAHWQLILLNALPWILRFFTISLVHLLFWKPKYLKVQYLAIIKLFQNFKVILNARKSSHVFRRIKWWQSLRRHQFFLKRDIKNFYTFIIKRDKSFYEKY